MNGPRLFQRFLPGGAQRFEQTLVLNHSDMHNLILIVTDNQGRQAISDEEWDKNQLLQLTWCADRNNQLSWAGLPDAKSVFGSAAGGYPTPVSQEKGGFRESLPVDLNTDLAARTFWISIMEESVQRVGSRRFVLPVC